MRHLWLLAALLAGLAPNPAISEIEPLATWEGQDEGDQFGIAVAVGGDINNDGRADLAIGASTNDEGGENAGKVSVFLGRTTPSTTPDLELIGAAGSFFGSAVAWAGDVNGDGYDDLLVGAFSDDEAGTNAGKAYLFLGGDPPTTSPDLTLPGPEAGAYFGRAVSGVGDLNGDELSDFAVGAPRTTNGSVYVYLGADPPVGTPELVIDGLSDGDRFGTSIAGVGNVDGIAGDDLLVGAPRSSPDHLWQGAIHLYSGGAGFDGVADWSVAGEAAGDHLGTSVAAAGDVNSDGAPDLLAGAPYRNVLELVDAGTAYLFYGGTPLDTNADLVIEGTAQEDNLGRSVAGCGDVSGSGFGHFLVGVPGGDAGGQDSGKVLLSPGGDPPELADMIEFDGEAAIDQFGYAVAGGSPFSDLSFSGDPHPDFCVGAWGHGIGGKSYLYGTAGSIDAVEQIEEGPQAWRLAISPNPGSRFELQFQRMVKNGVNRFLAPQVRILGPDGRLVRLLDGSAMTAGTDSYTVRWSGRTQGGDLAPCGLYFVVATVADRALLRDRLILVR